MSRRGTVSVRMRSCETKRQLEMVALEQGAVIEDLDHGAVGRDLPVAEQQDAVAGVENEVKIV